MKNYMQQAAGALALIMLGVSAQAASITAYLDQTNVDPTLPDGVNYLEVTISDGVDGAIDFSVQTLDPLLSIAGGNYGIQTFAFNVGDSLATIDDLVLPDGWKASAANEKGAGKFGFKGFDIVLHSTGKNRLDPLNFTIIVGGDSVDQYASETTTVPGLQFDSLFGAHVAGFDIDCDGGKVFATKLFDGGGKQTCEPLGSAKFGGATVVPLPAAASLMMSGLAFLGGMARRRKVAAVNNG